MAILQTKGSEPQVDGSLNGNSHTPEWVYLQDSGGSKKSQQNQLGKQNTETEHSDLQRNDTFGCINS